MFFEIPAKTTHHVVHTGVFARERRQVGGHDQISSASDPLTLVACTPLISKSPSSTPLTGSLKVTSRWVSAVTGAPGSGLMALMTGGIVSRKVYCAVSLVCVPSKAMGGFWRSRTP